MVAMTIATAENGTSQIVVTNSPAIKTSIKIMIVSRLKIEAQKAPNGAPMMTIGTATNQ